MKTFWLYYFIGKKVFFEGLKIFNLDFLERFLKNSAIFTAVKNLMKLLIRMKIVKKKLSLMENLALTSVLAFVSLNFL